MMTPAELPRQGQDDEVHLLNPFIGGVVCRAQKVRLSTQYPGLAKCQACLSGWAKHGEHKGVRRIAAGRSTE